MIRLRSESASYQGLKTLHDINLTITRGEKVALVGQSGSGKSTLIKLLFERYPLQSTLVPQDYGLVDHLSVYHNVYMGSLAHHATTYNLINLIRPWKIQVDKVCTLLATLKMDDYLFRPVGQLSGGQKQRVAIARSLFQHGELLLADEPVSSLDEQQARMVMTRLNDQFSTTILALHDISLALSFCDRIIGLENGRIILDSPSQSLNEQDVLALY